MTCVYMCLQPMLLQWPGLGPAEARSFVWLSHVDGSGPHTWVTLWLFFRVINRDVYEKQSSWDISCCPYEVLAFAFIYLAKSKLITKHWPLGGYLKIIHQVTLYFEKGFKKWILKLANIWLSFLKLKNEGFLFF